MPQLTGDQIRARDDHHINVFRQVLENNDDELDERAFEESVGPLDAITARSYLGGETTHILESAYKFKLCRWQESTDLNQSLDQSLRDHGVNEDAIPYVIRAVTTDGYDQRQINKPFEAAVKEIVEIYAEARNKGKDVNWIINLEQKFNDRLREAEIVLTELIPVCRYSTPAACLMKLYEGSERPVATEHLYQYYKTKKSEGARCKIVTLPTFREAVFAVQNTLQNGNIAIKCVSGDMVALYHRSPFKPDFLRPINHIWVDGSVEQLEALFTRHPRVDPLTISRIVPDTLSVYIQAGGRSATTRCPDYREIRFVFHAKNSRWSAATESHYDGNISYLVVKPQALCIDLLRDFYTRPDFREDIRLRINSLIRNVPEAIPRDDSEEHAYYTFFESCSSRTEDPLAVSGLHINIAQELFSEGFHEAQSIFEVIGDRSSTVQVQLSISLLRTDAHQRVITFQGCESLGTTTTSAHEFIGIFDDVEQRGVPLDYEAKEEISRRHWVTLFARSNHVHTFEDEAKRLLPEYVSVTATILPAAEIFKVDPGKDRPLDRREADWTSDDLMIKDEDSERLDGTTIKEEEQEDWTFNYPSFQEHYLLNSGEN